MHYLLYWLRKILVMKCYLSPLTFPFYIFYLMYLFLLRIFILKTFFLVCFLFGNSGYFSHNISFILIFKCSKTTMHGIKSFFMQLQCR